MKNDVEKLMIELGMDEVLCQLRHTMLNDAKDLLRTGRDGEEYLALAICEAVENIQNAMDVFDSDYNLSKDRGN